MRPLVLVTAAVAAAAILATPALGKPTPKQELHRQQARYYHAVGYLEAISRIPTRTLLSIDGAQRLRWSVKVNALIRVRDDARRAISRLRLELRRPAHYFGWLCIKSREGSWQDGGAPYFGGLQMHEWWGGVQYANALSPLGQMQLAEREGEEHGFSYSWMRGQWPNTFPPCAGYFDA